MTSTYTPNKGYELQTTGENQGTWGVLLNNNVISTVDLNMGGRLAVSISTTNVTITDEQSENLFFTLTGTLTGNRLLNFPAARGGLYIIRNQTTGAFTVTAGPTGGTGVVVPQGLETMIFVSPTTSAAYIVAAPNVLTTQGDILYQGARGPVRLPAGTSGQVLTTGGAGADPAWSYPSGATRSSFSAHKNGSDQPVNTGSVTQVTFGSTVYNTGSNFSSSVWTPPAGKVSITATLYLVGVVSQLSTIFLYKNSANFRSATFLGSSSGIASVLLSVQDEADGSDTYDIRVSSADPSFIVSGNTSLTYFMGTMI